MKKIILFASYAPSLLLFRAQLIQDFLDHGCQVSVLAPAVTISQTFSDEFQSRFPQVPILSVEMSLHGMNPFKDFKTILDLKRLFKKERPGIVFAYTVKPVIYGAIAASWAKISAMFGMLTGLGSGFNVSSFKDRCIHGFVKKLYRIALPKCQKVIFQNPDDQSLFRSLGLVKADQTLLVNGSGVDLREFNLTDLPEVIHFIFIGRLISEKGIFDFIEAARRVHLQYPEVKFRIVGDVFPGHPSSLSLQDLEFIQSKPYFDFVGQVRDVRPFIAASSIMVLPSTYREGTPRSILEALAMGRPIITTDIPGCRETVVSGQNGFLIPPKNVDALVEKMQFFIQNQSVIGTMGLQSRQLAEQKFDVHQVNQRILAVVLQGS
jgi:hypothetical protein